MWSRMKALCQNCLVSKHSPGSSTHTFSHLLMLVLGLHRCVCFMHAWLADIHLCELPGLSVRPQYELLAAKSTTLITTLPFQHYSMFYSTSTMPLPLALSLSLHFYHPGAVQEHFPEFISFLVSSHRIYRDLQW